MNAERLLQEDPMKPHFVCSVCNAEARSSHNPGEVRVLKHFVLQREPLLARSLCRVAMHKLWKVELELVPVTLGVGTLNLAQLALKARVHDRVGFTRSDTSHVAIVLLV